MILLSCVQLLATPWTVAYQAPWSMGFSRQGYWSGLPFPSPGDLPNPGIIPGSPALQTDALPSEPLGKPDERLGSFKNLRPLSVANVPDFLLGEKRKNKQTKEKQCARRGAQTHTRVMMSSLSTFRAGLCRLLRGLERPLLGGKELACEEAGFRLREFKVLKRRRLLGLLLPTLLSIPSAFSWINLK